MLGVHEDLFLELYTDSDVPIFPIKVVFWALGTTSKHAASTVAIALNTKEL